MTPNPLPDVSAMIGRMTTADGAKDLTAEMRMSSEDESGKRDRIEFRIQRKFLVDRVSTFLAVLAPRDEMDKALLAIEQPDQATEALSYLPGLKKLSRLNSDRQLGYRGAKVTVQEMLGLELNQYTHSAGERVKNGEEQLIKVEFKEKPLLGLAFPRIVGYFREADQQPKGFELYDSRNELQKKVSITEVKQIQNRLTITEILIDDLSQKLKLKLETLKAEYDRGLPDSMFTEKYLISYISDISRRLDQSR